MRCMDLRDLALLSDLFEGNHINKINGLAIKGFKLDRKYGAIYKRLNRLETYGYICRGFQLNQFNTYYITREGIKFFEEVSQ